MFVVRIVNTGCDIWVNSARSMVSIFPRFHDIGLSNGPIELRHKRRITVAAASKILANLTYSYKGMGLSMGTMLAGVS